MSLGVEGSINLASLNLNDSCLLKHTSYLNFSHISVVTFGLSSISKNLIWKRISVRLFIGAKTRPSHLIFAIAATTSGLQRSFARTFMAAEEEDIAIRRDERMYV